MLFSLLAERYERGSVMISSNLPFSMTTPAAIDRLVHHCVTLELNIPSYRVEQAEKAKEEKPGRRGEQTTHGPSFFLKQCRPISDDRDSFGI